MPPSLLAAPHTASSSSAMPKRRRWTREQLLRNIQILADLAAPLPPTLPHSPPPSRPASPAPGFKRKFDSSADPDAVKRPRTTQPATGYHHQQQSQQMPPQQSHQSHYQPQPPVEAPSIPSRKPVPTPHLTSRAEPCEDGEVREEPCPTVSVVSVLPTMDIPIRRPKRGKTGLRHHDALHDKYHNAGRLLKYSGDARFWSTYPSSHKEYRPLLDPPHPSSPYHKHGGLMSRLELLDALICFTYSIWNRDVVRRSCNKETWHTIEAFLGWTKQKWKDEDSGTTDAEKAFLGLIWMIEAFIQGRKMRYTLVAHLDEDVGAMHESMKRKIQIAADTAIDPLTGVNAALTHGKLAPPMLPSPNSANSTPVNRDGSTPDVTAQRTASTTTTHPVTRPSQYKGIVPAGLLSEQLKQGPQPIPAHIMNAMAAVTETINPILMQHVRDLAGGYQAAAFCLTSSQTLLNLPLVRRCFPKTWSRMMYTTLLPTEEHEPDFEDEEGELFWPDQCITGEGLGWVCLMGKAMLREFGKAYGYKGLEGVVPKPKPEEQLANGGGGPPPPLPPAFLQSQSQARPPQHLSGPSPAHVPSSSSLGQRPAVVSNAPR
ncbi:hypothetical protein B0H34DRAFT_371050 [Crassisporium funariophilum]|nr:hypothetical protein B0H34DRAFT_371050 [Crassisporium funariophilum]